MREMLVVHRDNDAFAVLVRDHVIHVDQPYSAGGMDVGPTPVELFVASLAACAAHYARRYLNRHSLPTAGLEVVAGYAMSPTIPVRVSRIDLRLRPPARLTDAETDGLMAAVDNCTVHNSIIDAPRIGVHLETEARAA
ncbi:OsmC family protein [Actinomadura sp.]|uniref:OsmC family protein n=1 Tax=Actinomadura sp. TaxID=1989 RepID=UPI003352AC10